MDHVHTTQTMRIRKNPSDSEVCTMCKQAFRVRDMALHVWNCPMKPSSCMHCAEVVLQGEMPQHLRTTCKGDAFGTVFPPKPGFENVKALRFAYEEKVRHEKEHHVFHHAPVHHDHHAPVYHDHYAHAHHVPTYYAPLPPPLPIPSTAMTVYPHRHSATMY